MTERDALEAVYDTPMFDADGEPAAEPDDLATDAEADAELSGATDALDDEATSPASLDAEESPDAEGNVPPEVLAELNALRAQREQIEQYQRQVAQQQAEQYWNGQWQRIEAAYAQEQQKIYAQAEKAYDPAAFVRERMTALNQWKNQQTATYYAQREQAVWSFAAQQAVPGYAREVAKHYGLDDGDTQRLLKFPPDLMPQIAEELRSIRQDKRSAVAARTAANTPAPGSGAGRAGRKIGKEGIRSGSRESASLLMSLLRQ